MGCGYWGSGADVGPRMKATDAVCSLKLECEKLVSEKTEMQRHYVMVSPPLPHPLCLPPAHPCLPPSPGQVPASGALLICSPKKGPEAIPSRPCPGGRGR